MSKGNRLWYTILAVLLMMVSAVFAGTTGKIAGIVTDKSNGDPLPGANITVEGTLMGAATDVDGTYTILNVPPGNYNVRIDMLGYAAMVVTNVRIEIDRTARVDFSLESESVAGEEVVVVAEKELIKRDVAGSVSTMGAADVDELPVTSVDDAISLQAGVEDGLVIRGGEANEALFLLDGFAMRDARNNEPVSGVPLSAVQEVSVERGGFNAEYGQVRSGIVNVVTKEGSKDQYSGTITVRNSFYAAKHFDESPFDPNSMWLKPYLDNDVAFVGTENGSWDGFTRNQFPLFVGWDAVSQSLMDDSDPNNDLTPEQAQALFLWQHRKEAVEESDNNIDAGFGGPVPLIGEQLGNLRFYTSYRRTRDMLLIPLTRDDYLSHDWTLKLTSDISPSMKLAVSGLFGRNYNIATNGTEQAAITGSSGQGFGLVNSTDYMRSPSEIASQISLSPAHSSSRVFSNSYYSAARVDHSGISANFTHAWSAKTYYDISIDYFQRRYETGPIAERSNDSTEVASGVFANEAPFGWSPLPETGIGDGILFGGHTSTARDSSRTSSFLMKFDLTNQFNFHHQFKTGFEFAYNNLDLRYGVVNVVFPESNTWVNETYNPIRAAFYVQDKMEFNQLIANVGLRVDYHNGNTEWVSIDPYSRSFFGAGFSEDTELESTSAEGAFTLSPRIGISHPITESSKLFFHYGHFKQLPSYEQMYQLTRGSLQQMRVYGDPNLDFSKTVSYELGYDQTLLGDSYLLQVAGFYHDITNQLATTRYISADGIVGYNGVNNNAYEDIRGVELTLRKSGGRWFNGFLTYTYQVNTYGRFGRDILFEDPSEQAQFDDDTGNFAQDRPLPQPWANAVLSFTTPRGFGPDVGGLSPFQNWALTMLTDWRAGWYATRNPNQVPDLSQNVQAKDWYNLNLRLTKRFSYKNVNVDFLLDMSNVFNTRRLSLVGFYDNQDLEDYWNSLHLPESEAYDNIVGDDRYGEYRMPDVQYQPIVLVASVEGLADPLERPFYYETTTQQYLQFSNGEWQNVDQSTLNKVLEDKAYIDMPNQTSFNFLNPRDIFFGIRTSFDF